MKDDLVKTIKRGDRISIAAACFSIYAYQELKKQLDPVNVLLFGRMALLDRRLNRKLKYCLAIILKEEMTIVFAEEYDGTIKTAYNTLSKIYKMTGSK